MMPFSDEDLQAPVSSIIKNKIAPMLARDGGAIELLDIRNARVFVQLKGACVGCSASGSTLKYIVEKIESDKTLHIESKKTYYEHLFIVLNEEIFHNIIPLQKELDENYLRLEHFKMDKVKMRQG